MKKKIILLLLVLFLCSSLGAGLTILYIRNSTNTLSRLIALHQVEDLRQHLILSIHAVQSDLYTAHTSLSHNHQLVDKNVRNLKQAAGQCSECHHTPEVTKRIEEIQARIRQYESKLGSYMSVSGDTRAFSKLKFDAAAIGNELLVRTAAMSAASKSKLEVMSRDAMDSVGKAWLILSVAVLMTFCVAVIVAVNLTRSITRPFNALMDATMTISSGGLGYTIPAGDKTEFGRLAAHFNAMSAALKSGYDKLEQEIHERRQTEEALIKSEAFLTTIFDSIRDPFCILDKSFNVIRANQSYAQMKNAKLGDLIGGTCFEVLHKRNRPCDDCIIEKTFKSGDSCAKEKNVAPPGTLQTWVQIFTYPILDQDGTITHVIEYIRDITEQKRTEAALRESEERYALAARGANDGLWDWDLRNNRIYYSFRWKSMLGYGEKEFTDHPEEWFSRVHPDDRDELKAKISAHLNDRNPHFESEYRIMHRDGTFRWVLCRGLAVRDKSNRASRMAGSQTDITSRKKAEEQLLYDAFHDDLTGLPNRALFTDRLQHMIYTLQRRTGDLFAVLFLDMDRFKVTNDSLGHTIGDQLLIAVAGKLSDCLRPGDTVARLGGDEFAVLLESIKEQKDAIEVAERIHAKLSKPLLVKGHEVFTSVSIGIALSSPDYERPEQILRDADIAMYQAKSKGNAGYEIFDKKMHATILDRLQLESDLRRAMDHGEFLLHYQPIMDLKSHRLIGFEALIRWEHPKRGLVYPLEFIPLAEENGLINSLGDWITRESCKQLQKWQRQYPMSPPLTMSINISSKQFLQPNLIDKLESAIKENGLAASSIALEITESMIMENVDMAITTMERLREMGFNIYIDDFGTGYSSLNYLHKFPVTALKIDRTFVNKISTSGENQEIIMSIVSLANSLNLDVIAEGVELSHQLSRIKELECQFGQGFFFSEPMESFAIDKWIKNRNDRYENRHD